ncbi:TolC family protein [Pedobacter sp. MC2016-14]|uniref:TolC family protein n=1 Tax=Pedobacter sp. MC2016-14 TaxID=2897327 RepID=UPI001E2FBF2E|nr:TolC family protein [Pedobacter sp. MC2016-14]MCD0488045.1 TolC family protein [Pedobacter sp. MC2016-14]
MKSVNPFMPLFRFSLLFSCLLCATFYVEAQEVITIQEAINKTLSNNLQIKQSQLSESLSDENYKQSKNALFPSVNGGSSYNINFGRSLDPSTQEFVSQKFSSFNGNLNASVNLFQGFQKMNQIKQNKLLLEADQTNTAKVKNDLILQVITAYLQILYNKDFLVTANQQLAVAESQLKQQQQLLDVGNKTLADLSQAKSQVATAQLSVTNAANALTISYLTLAQLMDIPSASKYEIQAPLLASFNNPSTQYNPDQVYDEALKIFPDVKLAAIRTEAAKRAIEVAKGSYYPSLSFGGSLGTNYSSSRYRMIATGMVERYPFIDQFTDNFNQAVGINLQIPIFTGYAARSGVRRARISYLQNQTQEQLTKNNLNKVIYQAVADLKAAESRFQSTTDTYLAQKDAYYVIEQRYEVGLVNSLDYSTAQTNLNKAEIDMIQAKYDLLFRAKVIDYYLGRQITF